MTEFDNDEPSVFSSKFDQKPNKIQERINNAPPIPRVKKTRIQAVLTALPILMLMVGLFFHWNGERRQTLGKPIAAEQQSLAGEFDRITPRGEKATARSINAGDSVVLNSAPTVAGSNVLWMMDLSVR